MRIPLGTSIQSRDGLTDKDAKVVNGILEPRGQDLWVRKRPGLSSVGLLRTGVAQLLYCWNGAVSIIDDYLMRGTPLPYTASLTTLNNADKGTYILLSGGNLTFTTAFGAANPGSVRTVATFTADQTYYETTLSTAAGSAAGVAIGLANATHDIESAPGSTNNSIAYREDGLIIKNGSTVATGAAMASSDVIGVYYDKANSEIKFYKNNVLQATITSASLPSGTLYGCVGGGTTARTATCNFGSTAFTHSPGVTSTNLSPTDADLQFSAQDNGANAATDLLMIKNRTQGWTVNGAGTVTQITDTDYPGTYQVGISSLTRSGTVATAVTTIDSNFQVGNSVVIAGATPSDYNGTKTITGVTRSTSQTFPIVPVTITRSGTTATATCTSGQHGFANGDSITIAGAAQNAYNGTYTITYVSPTVFTYTVTVTGTLPATPATGSPILGIVTGSAALTSGGGSTWTATGYPDCGVPQSGETINIFGGQDQFLGSAVVTAATSITFTFTKSTTYGSLAEISDIGIRFTRTVPAISSITRSSTTVTVTLAAAHGYITNYTVIISGAAESAYNGTFVVTVTGSTTFTYTLNVEQPATPATGNLTAKKADIITPASFTYSIAGSPASPATGTITATGGRTTVPGIAYLDGYFCVMDQQGVIYNSASDDPQTWNPLEYTTALNESGQGVALAKSLNYVVAFKEFSTEFFYNDTTIVTGSPLRPVENGFTQVGCASGTSLALLDGSLYWMAQTKQEGRSVYVMQGIQQRKVSTPDVERILNRDDLSEVYAYGVKLDGHPLYILTLVNSNITLAYDASNQAWTQWSSLTLGSSVAVTSITRSGTTATVTVSGGHGLNDGDPVRISGANQSDYNGIFQALVVSSTVFTIEVANSPATPATGTILMYPYTESYFKFTHYAGCDGQNLLLHKSDGYMYEILSTEYQDAGIPINVLLRTTRLDGGSLDFKSMARAVLVGDSVASTACIRFSDDDMATQTAYRPVNLADDEPMIRRMGRFRRRTLETRHIEDDPIDLVAMEVETS